MHTKPQQFIYKKIKKIKKFHKWKLTNAACNHWFNHKFNEIRNHSKKNFPKKNNFWFHLFLKKNPTKYTLASRTSAAQLQLKSFNLNFALKHNRATGTTCYMLYIYMHIKYQNIKDMKGQKWKEAIVRMGGHTSQNIGKTLIGVGTRMNFLHFLFSSFISLHLHPCTKRVGLASFFKIQFK